MWKRLLAGKNGKWLLGLQILPYAMRMVEVRGKDSIVVRRHELMPIPYGSIENSRVRDQERVSFELEKKVNEWRCKGREVVLSIPLSTVVIRKLHIPLVPDKEIRALVDIEIENSLHLPFTDPVFDYVKLPAELSIPSEQSLAAADERAADGAGNMLHLLVVAASGSTVRSYVDTARRAGLKPIAVDIEPLAVYRALASEWPLLGEAGVLLVQINLAGVDVAIFTAGFPEFVRSFSMPVPFYNEHQPMESLELAKQAISHMEQHGQVNGYLGDLLAEVTRIMNFYQYTLNEGRNKVERVFLTGEFGDMAKLAEIIRDRLSVPVFTPEYRHMSHASEPFLPAACEVAVGLGIKDVGRA